MALPNYTLFRVLDVNPVADDPDWSATPSSVSPSSIFSHTIQLPLDIGNGRGPCSKISLYGALVTAAGALVDRGSMTFSVTPMEIARPGDPGVPGTAGAEPEVVITGTVQTGRLPQEKILLEVGPVAGRVALRIHAIANVPGTADFMRLYWRPAG